MVWVNFGLLTYSFESLTLYSCSFSAYITLTLIGLQKDLCNIFSLESFLTVDYLISDIFWVAAVY